MGFPDDAIDTFFDEAEGQNDGGATVGDALDTVLAACEGGCQTAACFVACPTCSAAVVDQVY